MLTILSMVNLLYIDKKSTCKSIYDSMNRTIYPVENLPFWMAAVAYLDFRLAARARLRCLRDTRLLLLFGFSRRRVGSATSPAPRSSPWPPLFLSPVQLTRIAANAGKRLAGKLEEKRRRNENTSRCDCLIRSHLPFCERVDASR